MYAQIDWSDQSTPFSALFDDPYFNTEQGIDESHYVFVDGNQLIKRWSNWQHSSFCIAETGFGSGLNFLLTCFLFDAFLAEHRDKPLKKLFFTSVEKYPLTPQDIRLVTQQWPQLQPYVTQLLAQYPLPLIGCQRIMFANVSLDLWLGDVNEMLQEVYIYPTGLFDCWYLDGFAPSKNPDMWNERLFTLIAASAKQGATLATFTAAGFVRRGLQNAGFNMRKRKGYGKKRDMLVGTLINKPPGADYAQHYRPTKTTTSKEVAIVGGGVSSACLTLALIERGFTVTLYCKDDALGSGASGNQQGALYPLLNAQHDALSQLFANSFLFARNYVQAINQQHPFDFDLSGLLQLYYDASASAKLDKIMQASFPSTLVQKISAAQTDALAGLDIGQAALLYPLAGWLSPTQMVKAIFAKAKQSGRLTIKLKHRLQRFEAQGSGWLCHFSDQQVAHDLLILTSAMHTLDFAQGEALPLSAARGQVTHIDAGPALQKLKLTLCHEGYLTPRNNGAQCMGATFKRHRMDEQFSPQEQIENRDKLAKCIKDKPWVAQINTDHEHAHVGIRCTTRDHFPYMGALPNYLESKQVYRYAFKKMPTENAPFHENLFILTGLGSRGLSTAPLLAEALASQINHEPLPLSVPILNAIQCNRQWINYLKKGKTLKF